MKMYAVFTEKDWDNICEMWLVMARDEEDAKMKAVKEAINLKQVDIKQYENRFDQFQNDIRLLKGKSITLAKLISTCNNFDISAELTLRDREGCANPMNTELKINLTEGRD